MTLAKAKNPDWALSRVHRRLASLLPLDVLATHPGPRRTCPS